MTPAPFQPASLEQQAIALQSAGRLAEAIAAFRQLAKLQPHAPGPHYRIGTCHLAAGDLAAAAESFRRAIRIAPKFAAAHHNLGYVQLELGETARAAESLRRAAQLDPANPGTRRMAGLALTRAGCAGEAIAHFAAAAAQAPADPQLQIELAHTCRRAGRWHEAMAPAAAATRLAPDNAAAWAEYAGAQHDLHAHAEALAAADRALALDPAHPPAHLVRAMSLVALGRLDEAWPAFEYRWRIDTGNEPPLPGPLWRGETLDGPLLVYAEQGFGDAILLARYLAPAAARTKVTLGIRRPLLRLFADMIARLDLDVTVRTEGETVADYAAQCPMMSLPLALGPGAPAAALPYFAADPAAVAHWRARLADLPGRPVGIAWSGNPAAVQTAFRALPTPALADLAAIPGITLVSLHKGGPALPPDLPIRDVSDGIADFADTAALLMALDRVVSVDSAIINLAGALGREALLLNAFGTDWRWGPEGRSSPFYPAIRVARQAAPGDWSEPLAAARAYLS